MNKVVSWTIINNEIDFISDVINYHLPWLNGLYLLDTGSTDGTLEYLKSINNPKVIVEEYHTKYTPEYDKPWEEMINPFPEVEVRNYAIKRCKELLSPSWLIQLDADEIFLPSVLDVIKANSKAVAVAHATINPVCALDEHNKEHRFGHDFWDPHSRIWNSRYNIEFIKNKQLGSPLYHCTPSLKGWGKHVFECPGISWTKENFHLHLHWMYGKKIDLFLQRKNDYTSISQLNKFADLLPPIFLQKRKEWEVKRKIIINKHKHN